MNEPPVVMRACQAAEVMALRHEVLRPHQRLEEVRFPEDFAPGTAHFCAQDGEGHIVCVASVWPEAPPWPAGGAPAWRLRGMATAPSWQGRGVGAAVLAAVTAHVASAGGGLLWCNARLPAVGFYERGGMTTVGEPWQEPVIGPHSAMQRFVDPAERSGHR